MKKLLVSSLVVALVFSFTGAQMVSAHATTINSDLMVGSRGADVVTLQTYLMEHEYMSPTVKGYFGALTKAGVMQYQETQKLPVTGKFDAATRAKLSGGAVTTPSSSASMSAGMPNTMTKAADLRVLLNALEHEHVDLASAAVRAGFDGHKSFEAAAGQLDKNSVDLSKAVGSIYGADAEAKFLQIWRSHIGFFVDYTVAAKAGDKAGMDKAVANLGGYVDAISDFFSQANPNLPREAVHQLVSAHVGHLKAAVDTYGAGDFAGSYKNQHDAFVQIGSIADALSGAIVKQNPSKF
ncbi:MAG: peptidoglycan-binding domain-containing protein [Patescibacteria group bacterium]